VSFTPVDRDLLQRCLTRQPGAWNDFVDRYLSLVYHAVHYTAHLRSARLSPEDVEDIAAEVLVQIVADDYKALRQFQKQASLATYLTVIARRICVHELTRRQTVRDSIRRGDVKNADDLADESEAVEKGQEKLDQVEWLLRKLSGREREIVRHYYLEGLTYEEISTQLNLPVNTIGSVLSRARTKLRDLSKSSTALPVYVPDEGPIVDPPTRNGKGKPPGPNGGGKA
jgi:RNA polymerase sigma-70 factor, ECF subfamily